ncbi:MAG: hypothetical protein IPJ73_12370 [Zoogloea sp.]|nr:hypothetical protein [Zoogloea sp.]
MVLKGEDIRRLAAPALDHHRQPRHQLLIRDRYALDSHSKRLLDRFL